MSRERPTHWVPQLSEKERRTENMEISRNEGLDFIPFVMETYGAFGSKQQISMDFMK